MKKHAIVSITEVQEVQKVVNRVANNAININFWNQVAMEFFRENGLLEQWDKYYTQKRDEHNQREKMKVN